MTRLIRLVRKIVALLMLIVGLLSGGQRPAPAPSTSSSPPPAAVVLAPVAPAPVVPVAPVGVVPHGPTPHCTYSMIVNRSTGAKRWIVVCIVYGQSTTLPGDWPTAGDARSTLFAFQEAWRNAVASGTPL